MKERTPCPNCGRPMGFEYVEVEPGKCQLWRWFNECGDHHKVPPRTVSDCFAHTSRRIREIEAKVADLEQTKRAAQNTLRRHHTAAAVEQIKRWELCQHDTLKRTCPHCKDAPGAVAAVFPDSARIE